MEEEKQITGATHNTPTHNDTRQSDMVTPSAPLRLVILNRSKALDSPPPHYEACDVCEDITMCTGNSFMYLWMYVLRVMQKQ